MTTVSKALAVLQKNTMGGPRAPATAADALRSLPLAKERQKPAAPKPAMAKPPADPFELRPVRQVRDHDNTGDTRLALRDKDTGEFVSESDARKTPESIVTDYVENRTATKKTTKKVAKKAPAKKAAVKKAAKKAAKKTAKRASKK